MNYKVFVQPQIIPKWIDVPNPEGGTMQVLNQDGLLPLPAGIIYKPSIWDNYSADATQRSLIYGTNDEGDTDAVIFAACPGLLEWKAKQIRMGCESQLSNINGHYLERERQTWPQQRDEAIRMLGSGIQDTPTLDRMAAYRGVTREEQAAAVLARVAQYDDIALPYLGVQLSILDRLYVPGITVAALMAEVWPTGTAMEKALASVSA